MCILWQENNRKEILDSGLKAYERMREDDKNNIKPMYRSRDWNSEERQLLKAKKKFNWWNSDKSKIQCKIVLFVTPTPGGILAKELREREAELNKNSLERIKIEGRFKYKGHPWVQKPIQKIKMCSKDLSNLCIK